MIAREKQQRKATANDKAKIFKYEIVIKNVENHQFHVKSGVELP